MTSQQVWHWAPTTWADDPVDKLAVTSGVAGNGANGKST